MSTPTPVPVNNDKANGFPQDPALAVTSQPMTPMSIDNTPVMPNSESAVMSDSQTRTQPAQPAQYSQGSTPHGQTPYSQPAYGRTPAERGAPQVPYGQSTYRQSATARPSYAQPMEGRYLTSSQAPVEHLRSSSMVCLILGILDLAMIGLFESIPVWIWGDSTIEEAAANGVSGDYVSSTKIGRALGLVGTWIWTIVVALSILFFIGVITFGIVTGAPGY